MPEDRRLAALMFTDIVGFTALMGSDEDKAFQLLEKNRNLHKPLIEKFHGTFHKEIGDAVLASFPLATDAVLCAEKLIKATNIVSGLSLRVGIHEGEVVFKEGDAYGDGVNIASRIQNIAIPDSVLVSGKVYDEIKNHPSIKTCSLGFFPFKNVEQPIEVFALVNEGLMIPETKEMLDKGKVIQKDIPHNLPNPATHFFGRKKEITQLKELLAGHRIVTMQGSGGCGKTRLAIEVARQSLNMYPAGIWFTGLAPITDPNLIAETLAEVLLVKPQKERSIEETMANKIYSKRMLVVLDNCEHLIDECARILNFLVTYTLEPRFLITSREAVNIPGEATCLIPPLPFPESATKLDEIIGFDSIQLFRDRVQMNKPVFELNDNNGPVVSSICQRLDGIPLAIEMAAARVKVMDPQTILDRLSDQFNLLSSDIRTAPPRHQTLLATINWSNDLLTKEEQILFHRLSVFTGDFDLEDAEKVCGNDPLSELQILDLLTHLVDKSLVSIVEGDGAFRYSLLELMKQYGESKLIDNGELEVLQKQYCDYYLDKTGIAYQERMKHCEKWFGWLEIELNNIQGALTILHNEPVKRLELASYLTDFFYERSLIGIGCEILGSALAESPQKNVSRARALCGLGLIEFYFMNSELGFEKVKEGIDIVQEIRDLQAKVDLYWIYGMAKTVNNEWDEAQKILEEGLQIARNNDDSWMEFKYKLYIAWIPICQLRPDLIENQVEGFLDEAIKSGNPYSITGARHFLGDVPLQKGDFKLSEKRYMEATKSAMEYGNVLQSLIELQGMAMSVAGQGRHEKGLRLFGASMAKFEEFGAQMATMNFWITCINRTVGKSMEILGPEKSQILDQEGRQMGFENAIEYAFDLDKD